MATIDRPFREDEGARIWARLIEGDPVAPSILAEAYLAQLTTWLMQRNPRASEHDCLSAAGDAILSLIKRPSIYNPERQTLEVFLRMSAGGDLKNLLRPERRHAQRRVDLSVIEVPEFAGKYVQDEEDDPANLVERAEAEAERRAERMAVDGSLLEGLSPADRQVWGLMCDGERRTSAFAAVLGILDRPRDEQAREVKRVKDRLKKRLERRRRSHG